MRYITIKKNNGMALLVSVVTLTIILCLTLNSIKNTQFNERLAINFQSQLQSEAAAQAAVLEGQQFIMTQPTNLSQFTASCTSGLCTNQKLLKVWTSDTIWRNAKVLQSSLTTKSKIKSTPTYIIEYIGDKSSQDSLSVNGEYGSNKDVSTKPIYRVTGKSKGKKGEDETVIQSTIY